MRATTRYLLLSTPARLCPLHTFLAPAQVLAHAQPAVPVLHHPATEHYLLPRVGCHPYVQPYHPALKPV